MKRVLFICMLLLSCIEMTNAQITTSGMNGKVVAGGETVIGATVVAIHEPSGTNYGTATNLDGRFSFQGMRTGGPYKVTISYIGYQTVAYTDIQLQLGEIFSLDVTLHEASSLLKEVTVTASKSKFSAEKTGASTNISSRQLTTLPSISRTLSDFTRISPYASGNAFGGRDGRSNSFTVDGANLNNNFGLSSALPGGGNPISLDAIDEVQVVIAPFDVRQANFIGAGINAITKSGTNTYKGSAYTYFNNEAMRGNKIDKKDFGVRAEESKTIYGATFGGPIIKNKLFFFANAEYEKSPKQVVKWRAAQAGETTDNSTISRTTEADMKEFSHILQEQYGYNTGSFSDFPADITNLKLLGRIDWNINKGNKLSVRYNFTNNTSWNAPNESSSNTGYRLPYGRVSQHSMSYANSCYSQQNIVNSVTSELNSRFTNAMSNQLLFTYSDITDERGSNSDPFPFIDIMYGYNEDGTHILEPYMTAGYELFTYNNRTKNTVMTLVDNFTYYLGSHKLTAGISYELQKASNSYMRNGTGYYRYASFDDFKNEAAPESFALSYGYNGNSKPAAEVSFGQFGGYLQDDWHIRDNFKLTAGIRMDNLSFLNDIMRNQAIYNLEFNGKHIDTGAWPDSKLQFSPRLGFTWDVFNDKTLKIRGGSGLFTGRIPLVFFTNMPTSSGMIQNLVSITTSYKDGKVTKRDPRLDLLKGKMITNVNQMISILGLPSTITPEEGVLPSEIVGIDPDFKMPQVWKTSLALDYQLPTTFPLSVTVEGMFSKDINAVRQYNYNVKSPDNTWERFNGPDDRYIFPTDRLVHKNINSANVLANTSKGWGWTGNITVTAEPTKTLHIMVAYTHTESKEISGMPGSNANSAWSNMPSVNGPNNSEVMRSRYVTPNRVIASINWRVHLNKRSSSNLSLFYAGYSPVGYNFMYINDMNGDGIANDLIYIPKHKNEIKFKTPEDADAFWKFANQDPYLKKHKGEYAEAYAARAPWVHRFDFRWSRDFFVKVSNTKNTLQLSLDILNVGNLLNNKWGVNKNMSISNGGRLLKYEGKDEKNTPVFSMYKDKNSKEYPTESFSRNLNYSECWRLQIGLRYFFN